MSPALGRFCIEIVIGSPSNRPEAGALQPLDQVTAPDPLFFQIGVIDDVQPRPGELGPEAGAVGWGDPIPAFATRSVTRRIGSASEADIPPA